MTPDASAVALSLPGFGLVLRARADQPFAYLCDALTGLKPSDVVPSFAYLGDRSLLMGSADGVRIVSPEGCPRAEVVGELASAPVLALAVSSGATDTAYAVASGSAAGLWQSRDGGKHWQLRAQLDESELSNALVVSKSDPNRVYVSMRAAAGPLVLAYADGDSGVTKFPQELPLTLLSADGRAPYPLWAMARDALTVGNRGLAILRAQGPAGPWQTVLRVNYFGGLVIDGEGVIWVGDEIGGLYRSADGGDSFVNQEADADIACLASAGGALWACTPGTLKEPAVQKIAAGQPRAQVVALPDVDRLVTCPELDVAKSCATAWVEWQRDVRLMPIASQDAGSATQDAGPTVSSEVPDAMASEADAAVAPDAGTNQVDVPADGSALPPERKPRSDCALGPVQSTLRGTRPTSYAGTLPWLVAALLLLRRRLSLFPRGA